MDFPGVEPRCVVVGLRSLSTPAALVGGSGRRGEAASDRVEVDQRGGPGGLQSSFGAAEVAAFAGAVAVSKQAEQPLDPRSGAAQVLGGGGVLEGLAGGDQ